MSLLKTITNIFNNKEKHSGRYIEYTPIIKVIEEQDENGCLISSHIHVLENGEEIPADINKQNTIDTIHTMKTLTKKPRRVVRVNYENDLYGYRYQTVTES